MNKQLLLLLLLSLFFVNTVVAQEVPPTESAVDNANVSSDTAEVPFLGFYLVGMLGAARRRRHQLNDYHYEPRSPIVPSIPYYLQD